MTELAAAGIRVHRDGADLLAEVAPGASLDSYRERIAASKKNILRDLLKSEIIAALDVEPADFDRAEYERLLAQFNAVEGSSE
jgi:hypothetical protein